MKQLLALTFILIFISSCKKEFSYSGNTNNYLQTVQAGLKDSLPVGMYESLGFSQALRAKVGLDTFSLRVPFKGKSIGEEFVLLQTDRVGRILRGRMIEIERTKVSPDESPYVFNGHIIIRSLKGETLTDSPIENGSIKAFHPDPALSRPLVVPDNYITLDEVIVVATRSSSGMSFSSYVFLQSLFGSRYEGSNQIVYSDMDGGSGTGGYGGGYGDVYLDPYNYNEGIRQEQLLTVDFEFQQYNPAIDVEKFLKCFSLVPDNGATCSIEILSDIPVDGDPNKLFNITSESAGHAFLQIKKTNGGQSVMQNIGFYPTTNWKVLLTPAPVDGKLVDNGNHEYNASFKVNITPEQLQSALIHISYLARFIKYDIDDYNCTDFALEVFNKVRHPTQQLYIPKYDIPGGMAPAGTNTPQGLYNQLMSMQQTGHPEASNITIPGYKGWVNNSTGPCN